MEAGLAIVVIAIVLDRRHVQPGTPPAGVPHDLAGVAAQQDRHRHVRRPVHAGLVLVLGVRGDGAALDMFERDGDAIAPMPRFRESTLAGPPRAVVSSCRAYAPCNSAAACWLKTSISTVLADAIERGGTGCGLAGGRCQLRPTLGASGGSASRSPALRSRPCSAKSRQSR